MKLSAESIIAIVDVAAALPSAVITIWAYYRRSPPRRRHTGSFSNNGNCIMISSY